MEGDQMEGDQMEGDPMEGDNMAAVALDMIKADSTVIQGLIIIIKILEIIF